MPLRCWCWCWGLQHPLVCSQTCFACQEVPSQLGRALHRLTAMLSAACMGFMPSHSEVKMPKPHAKKPHAGLEMAQRALPAHHEFIMPRQVRPSGRMCSNPQCKNPFDSPQWRRGPLGPGTLCNACGTRYARLQAKMNGDKKVLVGVRPVCLAMKLSQSLVCVWGERLQMLGHRLVCQRSFW